MRVVNSQHRILFFLLASSTFHQVKAFTPSHAFACKFTKLQGSSNNDEISTQAEELRVQAAKIRSEISDFEQAKQDEKDKIQAQIEEAKIEKQQIRDQYSVDIPILKGDGSTEIERVDFAPRASKAEGVEGVESEILAFYSPLPLGMIIGEIEEIPGLFMIDEIPDYENANSAKAGLQVGDYVRAVTACQTTMETPTWQLMMGGIGVPKTKRFMFSIDGETFENVMDAIGSNRMDPEERDICIVVERVIKKQ